MLVLRFAAQQSKHLPFQSSYWVAAITVRRSNGTTAEASKHPSSQHVRCHNSVAPFRSAALLPPDLRVYHLCEEKQAVLNRPIANLGFRKACPVDNVKWAPRGSRAISVKRKNRSGGGLDSNLFEEWLKANPLPDVSLQEVNQRGNGSHALDAHDDLMAPAPEFGAYDNPGNEKFRIRNGKTTVEECGDFEMLRDTNGMLDSGQELSILNQLETSFDKVNDFSDGPENVSGFGLRDQGLQHQREFSWQQTGDILYKCLCECDDLAWDCEQKRFFEVNPSRGGWRIEFTPPLIQPPLSSCCTPQEYLQSLQQRRQRQGNKQLLVLLSSNAAALAIFSDGKLLLHKSKLWLDEPEASSCYTFRRNLYETENATKVITAYTVRAKQGKSQLKYLRQGGPGRMTVGGAIRAREADRLFTRVCEKLNEWGNEIQDCEVLFFSGTTRVWNEVYTVDNSKMLVPRNDSRWCKVPYDVHEPRFREVQRVFYKLSHGAVGYSCHREQQPLH